METNTGYLFYKEYFNKNFKIGIDKKARFKPDSLALKKLLFDVELSTVNTTIGDEKHSLLLTTTYPGLLIGSGYIHEIGGVKDNTGKPLVENELKLGFFFDHSTGLPIIPGSSVKGVLRSAFKKADKKAYIKELLEIITNKQWGENNIMHLEKNIFDGDEKQSIYKRDVFFDAFPVMSGNKQQRFLANDYITPHKDNPLKNPNPIQFLKVLPNIQFQFDFKLNDYKKATDEDYLSAENKKELFKLILLDLGVGAKTNVGYGQFVDEMEETNDDKKKQQKKSELNPNIHQLEIGNKYKARITGLTNGFFIDFGFDLGFTPKIFGISPKGYFVGQIIEIEVVKKGKYLSFNIIKPTS